MRIALPLVALMLASCASFHEQHYFQTTDSRGEPINYFRVRVDGSSGLSNMRYLSGFFDERAVDLYFNEVKPTSATPDTAANIEPLFQSNQKSPGTDTTIAGLEPTTHGALVMIFSSNPNAVADTIGQFAETQQVADALTNLVNRDRVRAARTSTRQQAIETKRLSAASCGFWTSPQMLN